MNNKCIKFKGQTTITGMKIYKNTKYVMMVCMLVLFAQAGVAQGELPEIERLLSSSQSFYTQHPKFQVALQYRLYRTPEQPVEIESYNGILIKDHNNLYLRIHQTEFITAGERSLKINHEEKAMEYMRLEYSGIQNNPLDIESYLKFFAERKVLDGGKVWICQMVTPKYTQLPYASIAFYLSKETYEIQKQVIELVSPASIKDEQGKLTGERKFLETTLRHIIEKDQRIIDYPQMNTYITVKNGVVIPLEAYKSYEFYHRS